MVGIYLVICLMKRHSKRNLRLYTLMSALKHWLVIVKMAIARLTFSTKQKTAEHEINV
ncbi:Uncharacterised protein [Serratia quinivorans]|nr:Uncharacterised protein [Serratia quinivorans]